MKFFDFEGGSKNENLKTEELSPGLGKRIKNHMSIIISQLIKITDKPYILAT